MLRRPEPPSGGSPRPPLVDAALAVLIVASAAYAAAPDSVIAPLIKPLPALATAVAVGVGLRPLGDERPGRPWLLVAAFVVAAVGDVLVEFEGTQQLGTAAFALMVFILGAEIGALPGRRTSARWPGIVLAAAWAMISGALVLGELDDRLGGGIAILVFTAFFIARAAARSPQVGAGALLVATNFTLFAVDAFVTPVPRWLVIGAYDVGLLLLALGIPSLLPPSRRTVSPG